MAEKEGFIALIKTEELRLLQKKDSLLVKLLIFEAFLEILTKKWFKIYEIMGRKTLNIVNYHFTKMKMINEVSMNPCILNPKKIIDLLEACPPLREFFDSLEKRDKKYLISSSQIFEIEPNVCIFFF